MNALAAIRQMVSVNADRRPRSSAGRARSRPPPRSRPGTTASVPRAACRGPSPPADGAHMRRRPARLASPGEIACAPVPATHAYRRAAAIVSPLRRAQRQRLVRSPGRARPSVADYAAFCGEPVRPTTARVCGQLRTLSTASQLLEVANIRTRHPDSGSGDLTIVGVRLSPTAQFQVVARRAGGHAARGNPRELFSSSRSAPDC